MAAGRLKTKEDIVDGLETFPDTLLKLFKGENLGKLIIKVADADGGAEVPGAKGDDA
jgi:NADPH-dependent curcumin reductase CurA